MTLRRRLERCVIQAAVLATLSAIALASAVPAWADFDKPVNISPRQTGASSPHVAMDAGGNALIVWLQYENGYGRVFARFRTAAGVLQPGEFLSPAGQYGDDPQVAMTPNGDALVIWEQSGPVWARARSAAGVWGPRQKISRDFIGSLSSPQVAIAPNGDALIVWTEDDRIKARARAADGTLSRIQTLSRSGDDASHQQVAIDSNGNALVVWHVSDGGNERVQARARAADGSLGPLQTLKRGGHFPQVAMDGNGNAIVVWSQTDIAADQIRIQARTRSSGGVLGAVRNLSRQKASRGVEIAMNASGNAFIIWTRVDGSFVHIEARSGSSSGIFGPLQKLSRRDQDGDVPQVAIDADGNGVAVWQVTDEASFSFRIQGRALFAGGGRGALETLSQPTEDWPQVAIGNGIAVAVWSRLDKNNIGRIQASVGP